MKRELSQLLWTSYDLTLQSGLFVMVFEKLCLENKHSHRPNMHGVRADSCVGCDALLSRSEIRILRRWIDLPNRA